jgi:hypothetical protein
MRALACVALAGALVVAIPIAMATGGCGLSVAGLETSGATGDGGSGEAGSGADSGSGSGGVDAGDDAPSFSTDGATNCLSAIPSGWSLVAYESAQGACPAGYGGEHDEYIGVSAGAGACTCTCQITTQPSCTAGTLTTSYGIAAGTCPSPGETFAVNGSTCSALPTPGNLAAYYASQPLAPSGGSCTGLAAGNTSQVTKLGVRYCDVPMASAESVCEGMPPATFAACIVTSGDVACPTNSPFANKTLVADDEMLVCSACTSCTVGGACSDAKVTFYSDLQCNVPVVQLASDGTCVATNSNARTVVAAEYSATPNATCHATGSTASFSPLGPHTLCCR